MVEAVVESLGSVDTSGGSVGFGSAAADGETVGWGDDAETSGEIVSVVDVELAGEFEVRSLGVAVESDGRVHADAVNVSSARQTAWRRITRTD